MSLTEVDSAVSYMDIRSKIADFFEPALKSIIQVIEEQSSTSLVPIKVHLYEFL